MKDAIQQKIAAIELKHKIEILYACESGSRAWGFASEDSDYDIRFIYRYASDEYLAITHPKETIDLPIDENKLDFSGWDLRKTLGLLSKSNAVVFEWLQSPIVYTSRKAFQEELWELAQVYATPRVFIKHYLGTMRSAYQQGVSDGKVNIKKYFYILRPLFAAMWIRDYGQPAPMVFDTLLKKAVEGHEQIHQIIQRLLAEKKQSSEGTYTVLIPELEEFIATEMDSCERLANRLLKEPKSNQQINQFFRKTVNKPLSPHYRLSL